jgi:UDP-N-acetylmuramate: L-alanyl-gamma-D-glutamyl-meso-diaminopimelate ligase
MRLGVHQDSLAESLRAADRVFLHAPDNLGWDSAEVMRVLDHGVACPDTDQLLIALLAQARPGDHVLIMSNGGFGGLHQRLLEALAD